MPAILDDSLPRLFCWLTVVASVQNWKPLDSHGKSLWILTEILEPLDLFSFVDLKHDDDQDEEKNSQEHEMLCQILL